MSSTNPTNVLSEWDALQIKYGNYEAPAEEPKEVEANARAVDLVLEAARLRELEHGKCESDSEDELERIRLRRRAELVKKKARARFGSVVHLGQADFLSEVTEASKKGFNNSSCAEETSSSFGDEDEQTEGCYVVVHVYEDHVLQCVRLNELLTQLAPSHAHVKFTKGKAADIIPNYPESSLPTLLIYKAGTCVHQLVGTPVWGKKLPTLDTLKTLLAKCKVIQSEKDTNPRDDENQQKNSGDRAYTVKELDALLNKR